MRTIIILFVLLQAVFFGETVCLSRNISPVKIDTMLTIIAPGDIFDGQAAFLSNEIARKFHFQYDYIGDLRLDDDLEAFGKHNDSTDSLLVIINGKDWKQKFDDEYSKSYIRDTTLIAFTKSELCKYWDGCKEKYYMVYRDSSMGNSIYRLTVLSYHDHKLASLMRFHVKYPELEMVSVDKQIIYRKRKGE